MGFCQWYIYGKIHIRAIPELIVRGVKLGGTSVKFDGWLFFKIVRLNHERIYQ